MRNPAQQPCEYTAEVETADRDRLGARPIAAAIPLVPFVVVSSQASRGVADLMMRVDIASLPHRDLRHARQHVVVFVQMMRGIAKFIVNYLRAVILQSFSTMTRPTYVVGSAGSDARIGVMPVSPAAQITVCVAIHLEPICIAMCCHLRDRRILQPQSQHPLLSSCLRAATARREGLKHTRCVACTRMIRYVIALQSREVRQHGAQRDSAKAPASSTPRVRHQ